MLKKSPNYLSLIVILAFSVCIMTSCSGDDSDDVISASKIEGQWLMTREIWKYTINSHGDISSGNKEVSTELNVWDFQSDGTLKIYCEFEEWETNQWSLKGNQLTIKEWDEEFEEYDVMIYTLTISDGKMIIRYHEKDDDGEDYKENHFVNVKSLKDVTPDLLGRWELTKVYIDNSETINGDLYGTWEFCNDGTLKISYEDTVRWRTLGNFIYIESDFFATTYVVSVSQNKLVLKQESNNGEVKEYHFVREGYTGSDDKEDQNRPTGEATIVGNWEVSKVTTKTYTTIPEMQDYYNNEEVESGNGEYWEFSSNKLIVHDPSDAMNGKAVNYTYNKSEGTLSVQGWLTYEVTELTPRKMTLMSDHNDGKFGTTTIIDFIKK